MKLGLVEPGIGRRQDLFKDTGLLGGGGAGIGNSGQQRSHSQANRFDPWKLDIHGNTPRNRFSIPYRSPPNPLVQCRSAHSPTLDHMGSVGRHFPKT
jgi:hypothetical protein